MKNIEQKISSLVKQQFPDFYKEEGEQFIAFVTAYYEWLEEDENAIGQARNLPGYRDIDETLEEFVVHFKEKYLSNIQFDTATNQVLLVKNALDLYRSKGTERSIDLFFKLVYGTSAEVNYPADNILRASDGIWEVPEYLEIGFSKYNIEYVGTEIVGARSDARAFVERYIRRKTNQGYVNLLYVSNIEGSFINNEMLGIIRNDSPVFDIRRRSKLIGSVERVQIENRGQNFNVGDIVNLVSSGRGSGGLARVSSVGEGTGIVDFLLIDGGYGYSLDTESIVAERVLSLDDVKSPEDKEQYFNLLEKVYQPTVNVNSSSINSNVIIGDTVKKYSNDIEVGSATIIDRDINNITLNIITGSISNNDILFTQGNSSSISVESFQDRTIQGTIMGVPNTAILDISNTGNLSIGDTVLQSGSDRILSEGVIRLVERDSITVDISTGSFKQDLPLLNVNRDVISNIDNINLDCGVYDIKRHVNTIDFISANNESILQSNSIFKYSNEGLIEAEAKIVTSSYESNSGYITILPIQGYFIPSDKIYSDSNSFIATVASNNLDISGGDFISSPTSKIIGSTNRTISNIQSLSFGSSANFEVSAIGDTEDISIGTDLLGGINRSSINTENLNINITSNTGFSIGDNVFQEVNKIAFNPNTSLDSITGFITLPSANTRYLAGDIVRYSIDSGNTVINGLVENDFYYVVSSNSTGISLAYSYNTEKTLNRSNYENFNLDAVSESGHYISKLVYGTVS